MNDIYLVNLKPIGMPRGHKVPQSIFNAPLFKAQNLLQSIAILTEVDYYR